jgi:hypothetical protein
MERDALLLAPSAEGEIGAPIGFARMGIGDLI